MSNMEIETPKEINGVNSAPCVAGRFSFRPGGAARRFASGTGPGTPSGSAACASVWFPSSLLKNPGFALPYDDCRQRHGGTHDGTRSA
jgi:hypothetical protein